MSYSSTKPIAGAMVSLAVTLPSGAIAYSTQGSQTTTDANGKFSIDYTPTVAGTYKLTATYVGNNIYTGTTSSGSFNAVAPTTPPKSASSITLTLASSSIETGKSMHANGLLSGGAGIPSVTVNLKVTLPDGTTTNPAQGPQAVTDANGKFAMDYVPTMIGMYNFTATYAGDEVNNGSSMTITFSATAPAAPKSINYYYTVSPSGVVKNSAGTTVYTGTATAAIIWAQSNCPAHYTICLNAGTFTISSKIFVYKSMVGAGIAATKLVAASGLSLSPTMIQISTTSGGAVTSITLSDMEIDGLSGTNSAESYGAVEPIKASYCVLKNLYIHDFPKSHGIEFRGSSYNTVENCTIHNIGSTVADKYGNGICCGDVITNMSSTYNIIKNCTVYDCSMVGYNFEPGDHNLVENCTYTETTGYSPYWMSGSTKVYNRAVTVFTWGPSTRNAGHLSDYNVFRNCYFAKPGIIVANYGDHTEFDNCTMTMTGNSGEGYIVAYAGVGTTNYGITGSDYASIHDCTINFKATSNGGQGIHLNSSDHCTITNNHINNTGVAGKGYGIQNNGSSNSITGTVCTNVATCVI